MKWGLVDRMLVAAQAGGLKPIVCLNKIDLAERVRRTASCPRTRRARDVLAHYRTLGRPHAARPASSATSGSTNCATSCATKTTVLAGHSGVGKSSLIRAIQPQPRPARRRDQPATPTRAGTRPRPPGGTSLDFGGAVIDTPGVKLFGLWGVTRENLPEFFPDVAADAAPEWRRESFQRIFDSLPEPGYG